MADDDCDGGPPDDATHLTFETDYTGQSPSTAIVETIATIEGVTPTDVNFTLHDRLDPEALDTILGGRDASTGTETEVVAEFTIDDYTVRVTSNGKLTVNAPEDTD